MINKNTYLDTKLLIFIALLFCGGTLSAQFVIENAAGDIGTSPMAEDIYVCFEQQDALTFRIIGLPGGTDPTLSINLATGRAYIEGSITIVNQSGGFSLGPNIGTATDPEFQITGTFSSGDFAEISMNRVGTCEAINQNGLTETVTVDGETEASTTHDALFLTLSMGGVNTPTVAVGDMTTLTGQIIGGGNGCVEEVVFAVIDDVGLLTTELRVEGNTLTADSTSGNTLYYTIGMAEINQVGDGDACLDALESLNFERDVNITTCAVTGGYEASWGCFGETCITTGFVPQQVNIAAGLPNFSSAFTVISSATTCDTAVIELTFTNNGTETLPGAGVAFDMIAKLGMGGGSEIIVRTGQELVDGSISDGMGGFTNVSATGGESNTTFQIDMSQFTTDPDGLGGLDDLDGDGQFDDLPLGESVTIRYGWTYICQEGCNIEHSGDARVRYCFADQCDNAMESNIESDGDIAHTNRFWSGATDTPTDVSANEIFDFEFCYSGSIEDYLGPLIDCPDAMVTHVLVTPPGFNLVGESYNMGTVESSTQSGDSIVVITDWGNRSRVLQASLFCLTVTMQLDCEEYISGNNDFSFDSFLECDPGNCGCQESLYCNDFDILVHCPKEPGDPVPGGFTIQGADFERITTGWADPYADVCVDKDTLTEKQLNIVMPCDTVESTFFGAHVADSLGNWFDNAHFWMAYDLTGGNTALRPIAAEVEIYDDNTVGSLLQTCTLGLPGGNLTTGGQHNLFWDISAVCGHTFGPNDSISMRVTWVVEKNSALDRAPIQIPELLNQFFSINMAGDTVNCDIYGAKILPHKPGFSRFDGNQIVSNGCVTESYGSQLFWRSGPNDPYPGEIRNIYCIDSFAIIIDNGDQWDSSEPVELVADGMGDVGLSQIRLDVTSFAEPNADGTRIVFRNDGTWPRADLHVGSASYNVIHSRINSCESDPVGNVGLRFYLQDYCHAKDKTCQEPLQNFLSKQKLNNLPEHEITDLSGLQSITQDTVCWTVQVRNTTNLPSAHIFLLADEMASLGIDVIAVQDITPDTALVLTPYANGEFIPVAVDFGAAATKNIKITAVVNDCFRDSIPVLLGYDCASFPTDPTAIPCELDSVYLYVQPLQSQVQIELNQEAAPYDICSIIEDTITITSALDAYITDLQLCIPLPDGLTENDLIAVIEYPAESGTIHMVSIMVASGTTKDTAYVDLMQHPDIMSQGGIPGTQDAGTAQEAQARVFLEWITDCDFLAGDTYAPVINANRPCGDPAIGNGISTNSDPLAINGAAPPYLAIIEPALSIDTVVGCAAEMVTVSSTIVAGTTTDQDTTFITLPETVSYVDGSFMCTLTAPADTACVEFVEVRTIGNQEQIILKIPNGINGSTDLPYEFAMMAQPDGLCNETGIINIDLVTTVSGISCATTGMNCPGVNILIAQAQDTLFFQKAELSFDNASVCSQGSMYQVSGELSTSTVDVAADETLMISVYCSSDLSTSVGTITVNGPIVIGSPVSFSEMISASCPDGDSFYLSLNPMSGNCICQDIEIVVPLTSEATATLNPVEGTCNGTSPNNDAAIAISSAINADEAGISSGAIYTGPAYGDAANIDISGGTGTLMNLAHNTQYMVRIFNTIGCFVDYTVTTSALSCFIDLGDLPDISANTAINDYQTLIANNGPVHQIITGLSLGTNVDGETDGQPSSDALGDGTDEDGIMMFSSLDLYPGQTFRLPFSYTNSTGNTAHVETWIDWNGDGAFDGADEMVINWDDSTGTLPDRMEITIPQNAQTGIQLGWRIRISNQDNMTPYGFQPNGEVEDYLIGIDCPQICLPIQGTLIRN